MTRAMISRGAKLAAIAFTAGGALALAACEEHPYPSAAPREATAAQRPDDATLAGAPAGPEGGYQASPTTRSPTVYPPQGPAPAYPPGAYPPGAYPPAGYAQGGYGPGGPPPPPRGYAPTAAPEIVTMAPIPNPPERPHYAYRYPMRHAHRGHGYYGYTHRYAAHPRHLYRTPGRAYPYGRHVAAARPPAPRPTPRPAAPMSAHGYSYTAPRRPAARPMAPATTQPQAAQSQLGQPQLGQPQPLDRHHHHHRTAVDAATLAAASGGANATGANVTAAESASEADRYQALEHSLRDDFANAAQLSAPSHIDPGQTAVATLTLPPEFAQTVRAEAAKQNLSQAAMSVNLLASLSGDGYTIVPAEAQSLPLTLDTPTNFQWKITPTGAERGPLRATVRAAMGEGHDLNLGDRTMGAGSGAARIIGIGILAVIALGLLIWASTRRRRPKPTGASRPRATHTNGSPTI